MTPRAAKPQGVLHNRSFTAIHRDLRTKICYLTSHFTIGSSSPLRGAATVHPPAFVRPRRVIIAPTRGSNTNRSKVKVADVPGHHRPYEGQQRDVEVGGGRHSAVIIAPTRGSNTTAGPRRDVHDLVIIAPTRGSNMYARRISGCGECSRHHRPYEGQQQVIHRGQGVVGGRHHRPYEGQQPVVDAVGISAEPVIIAVRGATTWRMPGR